MVVSAGLVAAFAPLAVVGGVVATLLAVVTLRRMAWLQALGWSVVATVVGADLVAPYLLGVSPQALESAAIGVTIWPHPIALGALAVAAIVGVLFGSERASRVSAWGGSMVAVSLLLGVWLDAGEPVVAVVALASLGAALVVGASFEIDLLASRTSIAFQAVAATAGALVVLGSAIALPDGRAGMPQDRWGDELTFASELASDDAGERILLVGDPESLPGSYRIGNGYAYRLVSGSPPTLDQAWLDPPRIGDAALATVLGGIDAGASVRPGRRLADFAVRWVVVVDDAPLLQALRSQVDLAERSFDPSIAVFENLSFENRVTSDAGDWKSLPIGAEGTPNDGRVRLADNADPGWRPDWEQADWANSLSAESGEVTFRNDPLYAGLAWASLAIMVAALAVAWWGRERST